MSHYLSKIDFWLVLGFFSQCMFFLRFFLQWLASEKKKQSVIPASFWYFSLLGGIGLLTYAAHTKDPVFILGQAGGLFVYTRNLALINNSRQTAIHGKSAS